MKIEELIEKRLECELDRYNHENVYGEHLELCNVKFIKPYGIIYAAYKKYVSYVIKFTVMFEDCYYIPPTELNMTAIAYPSGIVDIFDTAGLIYHL